MRGPRRWSPPMSAPAIAASRRRSCSRPSRSSTCPARTSASACISPPTPTAANSACGRTSPFRCRCDYLASPAAGRPQGFCYLGPVFRHRGDAAGGIPAGRHRILRPRRQGRGRRRDAGARPRSHRALRHRQAGNPHGRRRRCSPALVAALDLRAGLEAPAGQGLQPQDHSRARPRPAGAQRRQRAAGIPGRAGGAGRLRSEGARTRWSPTCCRSPASPRSAAARSARSPTASSNRRRSAPATTLPRETRALIERFLAIAGDPDEAAAELRALAAEAMTSALDPALDLFESRTGFLAARGVDVGAHPLLDRVRPRPRLLHRLRVRAARSGAAPSGPLVAGGRYDGLLTRLGARAPIPAVGFAVWIERLAGGGGAA